MCLNHLLKPKLLFGLWSLYRSGLCIDSIFFIPIYGLWKVVINQRFYPNLHVHQDLTVSGFHFYCFQLPGWVTENKELINSGLIYVQSVPVCYNFHCLQVLIIIGGLVPIPRGWRRGWRLSIYNRDYTIEAGLTCLICGQWSHALVYRPNFDD